MSKLAELLQSRQAGAATPATYATHQSESSRSSKSSRGTPQKLNFSSDLARRIEAMARRWGYTDNERREVMALAARDPGRWLRAVALDEQCEAEFRAHGLLPKAVA